MLAIDTSTERSGIALFDGACLDDVSWSSCREHTVLLLDEIDHQLKRSRASIADLGAVAIATGPGRFNALRVGMSVAKGLALSLEIPIVGISTLEAIAYPYRNQGYPVASVIDAGRGRISWQLFDVDEVNLQTEARNTSVDEFISSISKMHARVCVNGEVNQDLAEQLDAIPDVVLPPLAGRSGRSGAVAELAYCRFLTGDIDDLVTLEPVYLHGLRQPVTASSI